MEKIRKIILLIFVVAFSSCTSDDVQEDLNYNENLENFTKTTTCNIVGNSSASAGSTSSYTYTSDFTPSSVSWSILSGNITIISGGNSSNATLRFGANFSGGTIRAIGTGGAITCSDVFTISCSGNSPTDINFTQISGECPGDTFKFKAVPVGSTSSGTYNWTVFNGASIIGGQGTNTITVSSPSSGGFAYRVTFTDNCTNSSITATNLAEFDQSCGGGGLGGF